MYLNRKTMSAAVSQLINHGREDVYLTSDPEITFFRSSHKRHTAFSVESIKQSIHGIADFDNNISVTISKSGDLLLNCWVQVDLPSLNNYIFTNVNGEEIKTVQYTDKTILSLFKSIQIDIGGQLVENLYPEFIDLHSQLTHSEHKYKALNKMWRAENTGGTVYLHLPFYFSKSAAQSIPLLSLTNQDIRIHFKFAPWNEVIKSFVVPGDTSGKDYVVTHVSRIDNSDKPFSISNFTCFCDYVFLDFREREKLLNMEQREYLIEVTQYSGVFPVQSNTDIQKLQLNFSHPVKELFWIYNESDKV